MKTLITIIALCIAVPSVAETWKEKEIRERQEREIRYRQANPEYAAEQDRAYYEMKQSEQADQLRRMQSDIDHQNAEIERQRHEMIIQQNQQRMREIWGPNYR